MAKRDFAEIEELLVELFWTVNVYRKKVEMMFHVVKVQADFSESKFSNFECWQERSSVACTLDEKNKKTLISQKLLNFRYTCLKSTQS